MSHSIDFLLISFLIVLSFTFLCNNDKYQEDKTDDFFLGGGVIFSPKLYVADFGPLKKAF